MLDGIIADHNHDNEICKDVERKKSILSQSEYPCIRLEHVYETAVMKNWPQFSFEVLVKNKITFFEYINTSRYFNSYNFPIEDDQY